MTEPVQSSEQPPEQPIEQPPAQQPKPPLLRDGKVHLTAAIAGFIVASAVAFIGDSPVAWATPVYFVLGWPVMCTIVYWLARAFPDSSWRWTVSMMLGQVFSSIFFGNASFVLQAMLFVTLLSAPQFAAGAMGARAGLARQAAAADRHQTDKNHNSDTTDDSTPQDPL